MAIFVRLLVPALTLMLAACGANPKLATPKMEQVGPLKVHPGLLGQPVPAELQVDDPRKVARVEAAGAAPTDAAPTREGAPAKAKPDEAGLLEMHSVHFDYRDATIKSEFLPLLEAHARKLAQMPKAQVRVEGHADERGTEGFNQRLAKQRAEAVKQWLVGKGIPARQIKAVSMGRSKPKANGHDEASWAINRRADILYDQ